MTLKSLLSKTPGFISRVELQAAAEQQKNAARLYAQLVRYCGSDYVARLNAARAAYADKPTDANLDALEKVMSDRKNLDVQTLEGAVKAARGAFLLGFLEWVKPIWERALTVAEQHAAEIRAEESERIFKATGQPMTRSDIVDAAEAVVLEARNMGARLGFIAEGAARRGPSGEAVLRTPNESDLRTPADWVEYFGGTLPAR